MQFKQLVVPLWKIVTSLQLESCSSNLKEKLHAAQNGAGTINQGLWHHITDKVCTLRCLCKNTTKPEKGEHVYHTSS